MTTDPARRREFFARQAPRCGFAIYADGEASGGSIDLDGLGVAGGHLPLIRLSDERGTNIGCVLGWPIDPDRGALIETDWQFDKSFQTINELYSTRIRPLLGNYIAILAIGGERRIYLDAMGTLAAVYDPECRTVGGTASDILDQDAYEKRFDSALFNELEVARDGWFPAGLTAHRGISRLLPGHYLDLQSFEQVRHVMYTGEPIGPEDCDAILDGVIAQVRGVVSSLLASGRTVTVGLTGGYDSRLLLAALRGMTENVRFYTVAVPGAKFDLVRATELAHRFGLRHEIIAYEEASSAQMEEWDLRVGHCVRTGNRAMHPSVFPLEGQACIGGLGGEIGRCFLWREVGSVPLKLDPTNVVDRLKLPRVEELIARIDRWLSDFRQINSLATLDNAYIEQRNGPWALAQSYANPRSLVFHPIGSFDTIAGIVSLPADLRRDDGMMRRAIERAWPELLVLPVNRYGDWRDFANVASKFLQPARVVRKLRQMIRIRGAATA